MKTIQTRLGPVNIHTALPADLDAYRAIRLESLKDHPEAYTSDYKTSLAWPESRWAERLGLPGTEKEKVVFLAEAGGELAGMGGVMRGDSPKTAHTGTVVGIYVRPAWRGLRLGEAIMDTCEAWARGLGLEQLRLGVTGTNTIARDIYLRCGYRVYGVSPRQIFTNGKYYDEILMVKDLS